MPFWVEAVVKGTALLVVIFGLVATLKRSSAATRHLIWCFGLLGLLALPALSSLVPWRLPVLPPVDGAAIGEPIPTGAPEAVAVRRSGEEVVGTAGHEESSLAERSGGGTPAFLLGKADRPYAGPEAGPAVASGRDPSSPGVGWAAALAVIWLLGAAAILARLGVGMVTLRRYSRDARPAVGASWEAAREWARSRLLLDTPVRLLLSDDVSMPLTAGVFRPVVLMPEEAERWPDERRRAVLLHEMAHIRRRDVVPHLMAWVACALWWFHPLAWSAARRMRSESEKACDDLVLKVGTRASRYADDLLDIVTRAGTSRVPAAVVPLAQRSEFEGRILAILEPHRRRHGASIAHASLVALAVALLAVPLAAIAPAEPDPAGGTPALSEPTTADRLRAGLAGWAGGITDDMKKSEEGAKEKDEAGVEADRDSEWVEGAAEADASTEVSESELVEAEIMVVEGDVEADIDKKEKEGSARTAADGRAVVAMAARLRDDDPGVRMTVAEALGKLQDPRAVEALSRALREDPDAKVRAMAAWALGQIEDSAAVPALSAALSQDDDATVRKLAAEALGEIEDASAVEALGAALRDPSVEVRRTAVWALGMIEDARAVPLLIPFLEDEDVQVRRHAAEALGDIESSQAVDALIRATRDGDVEVRVNAIHALGDIEDPRALPALLAALGEESPVIRREAIDAIGSLDLAAAPPEVIEAVHDPDREVRHGAIDALDNFEDPAAVPVLLEVVRTSTERELQYDALDALSSIESPAAYEALIPLLQHEDPKIRQLAAQAIGNMQ